MKLERETLGRRVGDGRAGVKVRDVGFSKAAEAIICGYSELHFNI